MNEKQLQILSHAIAEALRPVILQSRRELLARLREIDNDSPNRVATRAGLELMLRQRRGKIL
jgi:hypothetical protein